MTVPAAIPTPRPSAGTEHLVDALRAVGADRTFARHALCELWRVLGPEVPAGLPAGAAGDWAEALRILDVALAGRVEA